MYICNGLLLLLIEQEKRPLFLLLYCDEMPRKKVLSKFDKNTLIQLPELEEEFIRVYSLSEQDISIIESNCRGKSNKLGFAVLLSYMRCPGIILPVDE